MVKFLVQRPVAVLVSFFALLLLGITAFLKLPVSLLPDVDIPVVLVRVNAANLSSQEVEERITRPLRNNLLQLRNLQHVESTAGEGVGTIRLRFEHGVDISMAYIEVNEKVDMAMNNLPRDVSRPQVIKSSVSDIPVFRLNMYPHEHVGAGGGLVELSSFAREVVRRRIEQLPEVAMVDITGFLQPQVEVTPKLGYLESLGLSTDLLFQAFRENTVSLGTILVKDGHYRYYLRFSGELQNLTTLAATPLNVQGRLFKLSDLADITYTTAESDGFYYSKDNPAINFAIIKQSAARMEDLQAGFQELLDQMKQDYPEVVFEITQDQTQLLDSSINNLQQDLFLGGVLAFVLMLLFIRQFRMAILIGVTMPLSLMVSQLGFYLFGISLNIISLGGLILGLSMIIDNSIVVMDTISGQRRKGLSVADAAIAGTNEIIRPLITSVLTNCAVFIPLIFMSGLAGAIFYDQAISIVIGVVSSLCVAILLLPPLYSVMHRRTEGRKVWEIRSIVNVTAIYDRVLRWSFRFPYVLGTIVLFFILLGAWSFSRLEKSRLPYISRTDFEVFVDWNEYLSAEEGRKRVVSLANEFQTSVTALNIWSGPQQYLLPIIEPLGYTQNRFYLQVAETKELPRVQSQFMKYIHTHYPLAIVTLHPARNAFDEVFADAKASFVLMVSDHQHRRMPEKSLVKEVVDSLRQVLPHANINPIELYEKMVLHVDPNVAARYGISVNRISDAISAALKDRKIADYQASAALVPLVLTRSKPHSIQDMLNENFVTHADQAQIPLAALVNVSREYDYKTITAGVSGAYYPIDIHTDMEGRDLSVINDVQRHFEGKVGLQLEGSYFDNKTLLMDMLLILMVSVVLLYFILAAQFESLVQPLFILAELPIALCGALLFLYLGDSSLNLMSMIGIVVMSGLIINDSILKIDAINQLRNQGVPLMQAIFDGGHKRLRSIVMITLTSIGALAPTLFMTDLGSELQKPLALALIGGMTVGLFVSLFFVPIVYWVIYRHKDHGKS